MSITQVSDGSDSDMSGLEKLINVQVDGQRRLEEAFAEARAMNERGEDGNAHYERIKAELFASVSTLFE